MSQGKAVIPLVLMGLASLYLGAVHLARWTNSKIRGES